MLDCSKLRESLGVNVLYMVVTKTYKSIYRYKICIELGFYLFKEVSPWIFLEYLVGLMAKIIR